MMRRISTTSHTTLENKASKASWLSKATFWYTIPIFKTGLRRDFNEYDLTRPLPEHESSRLGKRLSRQWSKKMSNRRNAKTRPSLVGVIAHCFGWEIAAYGLALGLMELGCRIYQPIFVGLVLRYLSIVNIDNNITNPDAPTYMGRVIHYYAPDQEKITTNEAMFFAFGIVFCGVVAVIVYHPVFTYLNYTGMKIRIAVCSLIYRKVLRLDSSQLTGKMIGNVINILSNDVNKFEQLHFIHYLWLGPATVAFSIYFIYWEIGWCSVAGMWPVLVCIPVQVLLACLTRCLRIETAGRTDNRVQVMNEIIGGIRVIKMYAWEYAFSAQLHKTRKHEMHSLIKSSVIKGIMMSLILFTTRSGHFFSCFCYLSKHEKITVETVFYIVSYYQILRMTMTVYYPQGMGHVAEMYVAVKRITTFLMLPETHIANPEPMDPKWMTRLARNPNYAYYYRKRFTPARSNIIDIQNASIRYGKMIVLDNFMMLCKPGTLTALIGPVGSGKSCVMQMILQELTPFEGKVSVEGVPSYSAQDPFIFRGSVRDNILFGQQYNREKYQLVIRACALIRDFTLLPYGDRTPVGEKGISLSGGQRARINLARCVYKDADIYLLDDPLSAVDANVGKHLFEECICGYLKTKIVVLATHQLQYLKTVKQIIVLEEGRIKLTGDYDHIFTRRDMRTLVADEDEEADADAIPMTMIKSTTYASIKGPDMKEFEEVRTAGVVNCKILRDYYLAGGHCCLILFMLLLFILAQVAASTFDYFISIWSKIEDKRYYGRGTFWIPEFIDNYPRSKCIEASGFAVLATCLISLFRSFFFYGFCMMSSINLHNRMFNSVTRANMRFFTLNDSGRILNRFSKDMGAVDEILPYAMVDTYQILLNFVGVIWLLMLIDAWLLIITAIFTALFYVIRRYYLKASCSLKRLEGIARSPVFTHTNATMQGLATIRAHGNEMQLVEEFDHYQDMHTSASFLFMAASRAFGYLLDVITCVYITITIYYFLVIRCDDSSYVGLILSQAIGLTGIFQWGMRQSAEFETQLTAVERVLEFTQIEPEPPLESERGKEPDPAWPRQGDIHFKNTSLRYSVHEAHVLRGVTFSVNPKEKIGIVGRTGAGKSSVVAALFRLAYIEGNMYIDGIETGSIGLHALRKQISIIPQEPVIFSGTLRYNLDPFDEYPDVVLYSALVDVDLRMAENIDCLDEVMSEGGVNLSVGSRQLVCLARAIVRNNKILIMDEATANVDLQTDLFIQKTIREKFSHCTVFTIAHRLNTIMDSDRVIVMDAGMVIEYDHPYKLIADKSTIFYKLISKTGASNVEKLSNIAKESWTNKHPNEPLPEITEPATPPQNIRNQPSAHFADPGDEEENEGDTDDEDDEDRPRPL